MVEELPPPLASETTRGETAPIMETGQVQAPAGVSPAVVDGGDVSSRGGKSTPEQRAKWKDKAQLRRLRLRQTAQGLPPPLPSVAAPAQGETAPQSIPVAGLPTVEELALVDWTPEDIQEITDEVVEWLNTLDKNSARKAAEVAKLGERLCEQIEADAEMPAICKKIFKKALPRWLSKMLNQSKVSAENKELAEIIVGCLFYAYHRMSLTSRIKKIVKEAGQPVETKA